MASAHSARAGEVDSRWTPDLPQQEPQGPAWSLGCADLLSVECGFGRRQLAQASLSLPSGVVLTWVLGPGLKDGGLPGAELLLAHRTALQGWGPFHRQLLLGAGGPTRIRLRVSFQGPSGGLRVTPRPVEAAQASQGRRKGCPRKGLGSNGEGLRGQGMLGVRPRFLQNEVVGYAQWHLGPPESGQDPPHVGSGQHTWLGKAGSGGSSSPSRL